MIPLLVCVACQKQSEKHAPIVREGSVAESVSLEPLADPTPPDSREASGLALKIRPGEVRRYEVEIDLHGSANPLHYNAILTDVYFGRAYKTAIVGLSGTNPTVATTSAASGLKLAAASDGLATLARDNPAALVMNGGFSGGDPTKPTGLLLVDGTAESPFNFARYSGDASPLRLDGVLCATPKGQLEILPAVLFLSGEMQVAKRCRSAVQSTPLVLRSGQSQISPREPDLKRPAARTVVGLGANGDLHVLFFSPVHLAVVAQVLLGQQSSSPNDKIRITRDENGKLTASAGLGLIDAINLDGDADSTGIYKGATLAGSSDRTLPSAVVIKAETRP